MAGHGIVRVSGRGVSLYTYGGTHLLADLAGWYVGTPTPATQPYPNNPSFAAREPIALYVPKHLAVLRLHIQYKTNIQSYELIGLINDSIYSNIYEHNVEATYIWNEWEGFGDMVRRLNLKIDKQ